MSAGTESELRARTIRTIARAYHATPFMDRALYPEAVVLDIFDALWEAGFITDPLRSETAS